MSSKKDNYINRDFSHDRDRFDSNISLQARAYIIAEEIAKGTLYRQIVKKYMDEWGVSYNYMHSIITESINMFNNEAIYKKLKDINLDRLTDIYAEARQQGDLDVAIKAVDKLNKTAGIYDTEKTQVQVQTDDSNIVITFGGESVETVEAKFNQKPDEAPFNEVGDLINVVLDKKETKN